MNTLKSISAPPLHLLLTEGARACGDLIRLASAIPKLARDLPHGDGHGVLVLPGFMAANGSTSALRGVLFKLGYDVHGWTLGRNWGLKPGIAIEMSRQLQEIANRSGRKVSLVGHSLGGVFARELAKQHPDLVRLVISLGSPFAGHPRSTNAWRLYQWATGDDIDALAQANDTVPPPLVPLTAIYSRSDGVVAWQGAMEVEGTTRENIEVRSSHVGMGHHPGVISAIADRLAQKAGQWQPFTPSSWNERFFRKQAPSAGGAGKRKTSQATLTR